MKTQTLQNAVLIGSLLINVILIAGVLWLGTTWRQELLNAYAEIAEAKLSVQERILSDLESNDPAKIEELKRNLRFSIDVQKRVQYKLRTNQPLDE